MNLIRGDCTIDKNLKFLNGLIDLAETTPFQESDADKYNVFISRVASEFEFSVKEFLLFPKDVILAINENGARSIDEIEENIEMLENNIQMINEKMPIETDFTPNMLCGFEEALVKCHENIKRFNDAYRVEFLPNSKAFDSKLYGIGEKIRHLLPIIEKLKHLESDIEKINETILTVPKSRYTSKFSLQILAMFEKISGSIDSMKM